MCTYGFNILDLNGDVLLYILEELYLQRCLQPLSATCKTLRNIAMPILFRVCHVRLQGLPLVASTLPCSSLWVHIRHLKLTEEWPEDALYKGHQPVGGPTICGSFDPDVLSHVLRRMPLLASLSMSTVSFHHALPWESLKAIITAPQLRHLDVLRLILCGTSPRIEDLDLQLAPLTSLSYQLNSMRPDPRWVPLERNVLAMVLPRLSASLQKLVLSSEPAPLNTICNSHWPRLREFQLYGEVSPSPDPEPYITATANMPELRSLSLQLFLPPWTSTPIIWPSAVMMSCPWPHLESITIAHPHPKDQLYLHLPPTLGRLTLCCYPHYYNHLYGRGGVVSSRSWRGPLLTAVETLELLSQCQTPELAELTMEFLADNDDEEFALWEHLASAFPRLTSLTVHAYRMMREYVDAGRIAWALMPLAHLQTLRIHLGFEGTAGRFGFGMRRGARADPADVALKEARDQAAQTFANLLGPSLQTVSILHPAHENKSYWVKYHLRPGQRGTQGMPRTGPLDEGPYELEYIYGTLLATRER